MEKSLLNDATSSSDTPTPGFMLAEIAKLTIANYQASLQLQDFLASRLTKNDHNVKYKCLVIIKHVCRSGRPDFKKDIGKHIGIIKECLHLLRLYPLLEFRGPPDPLRGDEIYKRVRDAAKEALDAIYDSQMPVTTSAVAAANRIQGMGGGEATNVSSAKQSSSLFEQMQSALQGFRGDNEPAYVGHPGATGSFESSSGKAFSSAGSYASPSANSASSTSSSSAASSTTSTYAGIGNPNFKDPREEKSWLQMAAESSSATISSFIGSSGPSTSGKVAFLSKNAPDFSEAGYTYATNRGPQAYGASTNAAYTTPATTSLPVSSGPWNSSSPSVASDNSFSTTGRVGQASSDGSYERHQIENLCSPVGLRRTPPEDLLQSFVQTAGSLSPEIVGGCLLEQLDAGAPWQSRLKALMVVSALVSSKGNEAHRAYWVSHGSDLEELRKDTKASVRTQANKTIRVVLNKDEEPNNMDGNDEEPKQSSSRISSDPVMDLLDLDGASNMSDMPSSRPPLPPVTVAPMTPPVANHVAPVSSIFAGLSIGSNENSSVTTSSTDSSSNLSSSSSGFVFMQSQELTTEKTAEKTSNVSTPISSVFDSLDQSLGSMSSSSSLRVESSSVSSPSSPFSNTTTTSASSISDAFDFLNDEIPSVAPPTLVSSSDISPSSVGSSSSNAGNQTNTGLFMSMNVVDAGSNSNANSSVNSMMYNNMNTFSHQPMNMPINMGMTMGMNMPMNMGMNVPMNMPMNNGMPMNMNMPMNNGMPMNMNMGMPMGMNPYAPMMMPTGARPVPSNQQSPSTMMPALAMNMNMATRTVIPELDGEKQNNGSGFSFMDGSNKSKGDSFSFVSEALKSQK